MTELKNRFLDLARVATIEFSVQHPGKSVATRIYEKIMDLTEEQISAAMEVHSSLSDAVLEFIHYEFTKGRIGFEKPSWLDSSKKKA